MRYEARKERMLIDGNTGGGVLNDDSDMSSCNTTITLINIDAPLCKIKPEYTHRYKFSNYLL